MSVVIAIKENNKIVMGCDGQISSYNLKQNTIKPFSKIWKVKNINNAIMGGVGDYRNCQLISLMPFLMSAEDIINKNINYENIALKLFKNIYYFLSLNNRINKDEKGNEVNYIDNSFIFAYKNQAYLIDDVGDVFPIKDYLVIGSGTEIAIGNLENNKNKPAEERIRMAINACADKSLYINNDVEILKTK